MGTAEPDKSLWLGKKDSSLLPCALTLLHTSLGTIPPALARWKDVPDVFAWLSHLPSLQVCVALCSKCLSAQVRKELEVNGIEFYPQKEFDEDLEDKTENDKIRVGNILLWEGKGA